MLLLFFLIIDLYFLISGVITQIFNFTAELQIPTEIPPNKAKAKIEIHPVTAEVEISYFLM